MNGRSLRLLVALAAAFALMLAVWGMASVMVHPASAAMQPRPTSTPVVINIERDGRTHRANILSGLSAALGGGGGVYCMAADQREPEFILSFADPWEQVTTNVQGHVIIFLVGYIEIDRATPVLCSPIEIPPSSTYAISPSGVHHEAFLREEYFDPAERHRFAVRLPLEAFAEPGIWTLGIDDPASGVAAETSIQVMATERPYFVLEFHYDRTRALLGGFAPNERIIAVNWDLQTHGENMADVIAVELTADADGFIWLDDDPQMVAFVGEYGGMTQASARGIFTTESLEGPPYYVEALMLWEGFWGDGN